MEQPKITKTDKGIKIITQSLPHCRSVSVMVGVGVGSRHETDKYAGISHFLEHMLFKGTGKRPNHRLITQPVENTGGSINASTGYDSTIYWCRVPQNFLSESLDLIFDMLNNSVLREADIDKERGVIIEELRALMDDPESLTDLKLEELMWSGTPLGRDIAGNQNSISNITKKDLIKYLNLNYVGTNIVVSIAGCLDHEYVVNQVNTLSGEMSVALPDDYVDISPNQTYPRVSIRNCDTEQSHIAMGYPGTSWSDKDRYALDILSIILCEGMSSRLFTEVREKRGLAYDISGITNHLRDVGSFTISSGIDKTKIVSAVSLILNNLEKCHIDIDSEEVSNAKTLITGKHNLGMDDPQYISLWNLNGILNNESLYSHNQLEDKMRRVNVEQIRECASKYLKREKLNLVITGPHNEDMDILSGL